MARVSKATLVMVNQIEAIFGKMETFPMSGYDRLVALLNKANNEALQLAVDRKIKFVWSIASRILGERKKAKGG